MSKYGKIYVIACFIILTCYLIFSNSNTTTSVRYDKPVNRADSLICAHFGNPEINTKMRADSVEMIIRQFYPYTKEELIVIKTMTKLIKDLREMKGE